MSDPLPDRSAARVRRAIDRALARAFPDGVDPWEVPRDLAVSLALAEGLSAEAALARCGIHVDAGASAPPEVAFALVPYGGAFAMDGRRYRKVSARTARQRAIGAPNAVPYEGGEAVFVDPSTRVRHIRERRRRS